MSLEAGLQATAAIAVSGALAEPAITAP